VGAERFSRFLFIFFLLPLGGERGARAAFSDQRLAPATSTSDQRAAQSANQRHVAIVNTSTPPPLEFKNRPAPHQRGSGIAVMLSFRVCAQIISLAGASCGAGTRKKPKRNSRPDSSR
jgi:hypothetical protein